MSIRQIIVIISLLAVYFLAVQFLGMGWTLFIFAFYLLSLAILFTINAQNYERYMKFINPTFLKIYQEKDDKFQKDTRRTQIIISYIGPVILLIGSYLNFKTGNQTHLAPADSLKMFLLLFFIMIPVIYLSNYLFKKAKKESHFLLWSFLIGFGVSIVVMGFLLAFLYLKLGR